MWICCIQDLFLRSGRRRHERCLEDVGPPGNLRGGLGRQERLPSWFVGSCKLQGRHTRSPRGGLLRVFGWIEVGHRGVATGGSRCRRCLFLGIVVDLSDIERLLTWLLACTWGSSGDLLLSSDSSGSIGILTLLVLLICFPS
jgi:hypothetical protein